MRFQLQRYTDLKIYHHFMFSVELTSLETVAKKLNQPSKQSHPHTRFQTKAVYFN